MARSTWVQSNFNGGEWSPLAHGRFDIPKYRNGLALCLNFFPTQQGGLARRPGTIYVASVKDSSYAPRLISFTFSLAQSYILEFGAGYIRFYVNDGQLQVGSATAPWVTEHQYLEGALVTAGGNIYRAQITHISGNFSQQLADQVWLLVGSASAAYEVSTPYTAAEVWELDFAQKFDTLYLTHPKHPTAKLQRAGAVNWVFNTVTFLDGPYLPTNATGTTLTPSGTSGTVTITASSVTGINGGLGFVASDVGRVLRIKCNGVWFYGTITAVTDSTHATWQIGGSLGTTVPRAATAIANIVGGGVFSVVVTDGGNGYGVQPPSVQFKTVAVDSAVATVTVNNGVVTGITLVYGGSGYAAAPFVYINSSDNRGRGASIGVTLAGGAVTALTVLAGGVGYRSDSTAMFVVSGGAAGTDAQASAVLTDGSVTSVNVTNSGSGYTSAPAVLLSAPAQGLPATTSFWRLGLWNATDGYPAHAAFHQDRLWLSGNASNPDRVDGSNTGDYENFSPSGVDGTVVDSHAVSFTLASGAIQWMIPDKQGLICGSESSEWVVAPSSAQQAITPTNVNARLLGNFGSANVKPLRIGNATLFLQRTFRKLREVVYQFAYDTFTNTDISLVAEHLTQTGIKQLAVQFAPQQIVWMVRTDGTLVGMTYDREQDINGWHRHSLGGHSDSLGTKPPLVESVACASSPDMRRDEVWLVVNRWVNGAVHRTIERMAKPWEDGDALEDAFYLDCGATYSGASTKTITGLTWLIGQTVGVLGDGGVRLDCVVSPAGTILLDHAAAKAQIGLGMVSQGKTLRIEAGGADGPSQGKLKRIMWTIFRFFQTSKFDLWSETPGIGFEAMAFRDSNDPMSKPVALFDGDKRWTYDGTWASDGQIYFQASGPLPCNLTLLMAQVDTREMQ